MTRDAVSSTTRKLWFGFALLLVTLAVFGVTVVLRVQTLTEQVDRQANVDRARSDVSRELEIHVLAYTLFVRTHLQQDEPASLREAADAAAAVDRAIAEYLRLVTSDHQQALARRFSAQWAEYRDAGRALLAQKAAGPPPGRSALTRFREQRLALEALLDDGLQRDAVSAYVARKDTTIAYLRDTRELVLLLLALCLTIDLAASVVVALAVLRDERRLRASEERHRLLVERVDDFAIFSLDRTGRIATWNRGAQRLFGWDDAEAIGRHVERLFPPEDRNEDLPQQQMRRASEQGRASEDGWLLRADGTRFWASGSLSELRDDAGHAIGYTKVVRDVTERRRYEEALRDADRSKDEFIATLAHELRNPLAPIRNALAIMRLGADAPTLQRTREMMERQVAQMVRLVDDLLDVSRISRGRLELQMERVPLAPLLQQAVESCRPSIDAARQTLEVSLPDESVWLDADAARLVQVLANLLDNASKFSDDGGRIELRAERHDDALRIVVRDQGAGIPPDRLHSIFGMFTQLGGPGVREGLGIGLTLVKRLVELHGGHVDARSDGPGRGSEFMLQLPLAAERRADAHASAPPLPPAPPKTRQPLRVLLVDDNRDHVDSLAALLRLIGHEVHFAHDGPAGVDAAARLRPDVVLLDIGLPGLDGHEACRRIRALPHGPRIVVVALSGWGQDEDRLRSKEAGFDAHLVKPVEPQALQALLDDIRPQAWPASA